MSEQPTPSKPSEPSTTQNVSGGVTVQPGGDANVGGDVVGRDKVTTTTTVTNVGMTPEAVRRLVITVGVLVFVTALCFFSGGLAVGAVALRAFDRPVNSTLAAAQDFQNNLNSNVLAVQSGQSFQWSYTETDLSSYLRFFLGPKIGFDGRARFLPNNEVAFQGTWSGLLGLPVTIVTRMETNSPQLYQTVSAAVQIVPVQNSNFGWAALPTSSVQPLLDAINQDIGRSYTAQSIEYPQFVTTTGDGSPAPSADAPLRIVGVKK